MRKIDLIHLLLGGEGEIWIVAGRSELVSRHHEEYKCRHLFKHFIQPGVLN